MGNIINNVDGYDNDMTTHVRYFSAENKTNV